MNWKHGSMPIMAVRVRCIWSCPKRSIDHALGPVCICSLIGINSGESSQRVAHALTVYLATDGVETGCTEHLEQQTRPVAHGRGSPDLQNPQPATILSESL